MVTLVADGNYPHLFRIRYPDGWLSTPANVSRAKEAAYGHARLLLSPPLPEASMSAVGLGCARESISDKPAHATYGVVRRWF